MGVSSGADGSSMRARTRARTTDTRMRKLRKHKKVAVVELISHGSPRKMFAGPGNVFSISPREKKIADLQDHQCGVRRLISDVDVDASESGASLHQDPHFASVLAKHVDSATKICAEEVMRETEAKLREEHLGFTTSKDHDAFVALNDARTLRVLTDTFLKSRTAKTLLQEYRGSVNRAYTQNNIPGVVKDVVAETKHLLLVSQPVSPKQKPKLSFIEAAVDSHTSSPTGQGFVQIMLAYLHANDLIHERLSKEELAAIQRDLGLGRTFHVEAAGRQWISYMAAELLKTI